jgi:hypothetical protein
VVSADTMAPMFKPDPMPVDVINVLALGVVDALLGGMTELIGFWRPRVTLLNLSAICV